jgi:hypothetical protein
LEVGRSLEHRPVLRVADKLGHVVEDDGFADEICTGWDVDDSRGVSRRIADPGTTTVSVADGAIDSI